MALIFYMDEKAMKKMHVSVVLPVHDEEGNLVILNEKIKDALWVVTPHYEVIYVDDGSHDSSFDVLSKLHSKDKHVKVIKLERNFGQTAAMRAGFEYATGEIIVSLDSDMQNDTRDIPLLIEKVLGGYDCVVGWRHDRQDSFFKRKMSVVARHIRQSLLGTELHDYGCSLKAYTKKCAKDLDITGDMHRYIPPILSFKGYKICEVKVRHHARNSGKTKYGMARIFKGFVDMFSVWFWMKYSGRPLHIFGGLGLGSIVFGGLLGGYSLYLRVLQGVDLSDTFLPVVSVFMVMVGVQFFVSGILADIAVKNYYRNTNHKPYVVNKVLE